jgi:hypothetical protein
MLVGQTNLSIIYKVLLSLKQNELSHLVALHENDLIPRELALTKTRSIFYNFTILR